jgi:thioredoxin 1
MDNSGDSLVAFDMYADWCGPCRILAPTLEKVAAATKGKVAFYRINLDQVPEAGQTFGVGGIPFVVFVKNKKVVATFTGVQPEESYLRAIQRFSGHEEASTPPGAQKM